MTKKDASHWDELFRREFERESDRSCAILATAMLDSVLEIILKAYLIPIASSEDNLLDGAYAPISTFSAKIDLCHRLGLISTKFCRDLHIIRRIRNDFAHNITGCTFEDAGVRSKVNELVHSHGICDRIPQIRQTFQQGTRGDFQLSVSWMQYCLRDSLQTVKSLTPPPLEWGYYALPPKKQ